ncbi:MAG: hypothetical protein IPJ46_07725 [Anaerolineales bacterium]|nr:hypothetical protein [Anaerolineales bacterium]
MFTFGYNITLEQFGTAWVDSFHEYWHHVLHWKEAKRILLHGSYPDPTVDQTGAGAPKWNWTETN